MKNLIYLFISLLILTACTGPPPNNTPTQPTTSSTAHFLISGTGEVSLKRQTWSTNTYTPIQFGTLINQGDWLQAQTAIILCNTTPLSIQPLTQASQLNCKGGPPLLTIPANRYSTARGNQSSVPYILHPRSTLVLTERPILQWHNTGATAYTIALEQGGQYVWQINTPPTCQAKQCELPYPADQAPLQPDLTYQLVVLDNDSQISSKQDTNTGLGFQLANNTIITELNTTTAQIKQQLTDPQAAQFALALYYFGWQNKQTSFKPIAEAKAIFNNLATQHQSPALYLWHADSLMAMKLPNEAEEVYQQAYTLAQTSGNLESQAQAAAALWKITTNETHKQNAIDLYTQLGDKAQIDSLNKER